MILLHIFTLPLGHLLYFYHLLFGGKGQAKDLKQVLLGRQPKAFIAFKKKPSVTFLPPVLPLGTCVGLPYSFSASFSLGIMKISSMGG